MSFEQALARGRALAALATTDLLASDIAEAAELHLHPEPYLTQPRRLPDGPDGEQWTKDPARWPGRGLRLEIGDRAYCCLILEDRQRQ